MSYQKIAHLVDLLIKQTRSGNVQWEKTENSNEFQASFPEYTVRLDNLEDSDGDSYHVKVLDWAGDVVEEVSDNDLSSVMVGSKYRMKEMYEIARRKVMGVEDALDSLIRHLDDNPF